MSWAALIRKVCEVDPLRCPDCGGEMKVIRFIDKCQADVVEKIVRHGGLWKNAASRPPPVVGSVAERAPSHDYGYFERVCI